MGYEKVIHSADLYRNNADTSKMREMIFLLWCWYMAVVVKHLKREWVMLWAKCGYAAIAMDLSGNGPDGKRLANGPYQSRKFKRNIDSALNKQWIYHSVANVTLAHSLLSKFSEVDTKCPAITGISWVVFLSVL